MKPKSAPACCASTAGGSLTERRPSGPESMYRCPLHSLTQRHSADQLKNRRSAHSLPSRFADILSLEGTRSQSRSSARAGRGLLHDIQSLVITSSGPLPAVNTASSSFDPMQSVTAGAGLRLSSPSLPQFSLAAADQSQPLVISGSRCHSSMGFHVPQCALQPGATRTPGDFPSNLLLAPIAAANQRPVRRGHDHQKVS